MYYHIMVYKMSEIHKYKTRVTPFSGTNAVFVAVGLYNPFTLVLFLCPLSFCLLCVFSVRLCVKAWPTANYTAHLWPTRPPPALCLCQRELKREERILAGMFWSLKKTFWRDLAGILAQGKGFSQHMLCEWVLLLVIQVNLKQSGRLDS